MTDNANRKNADESPARRDFELVTLKDETPAGSVMFVPDTADEQCRRTMWILIDEDSLIDPDDWR